MKNNIRLPKVWNKITDEYMKDKPYIHAFVCSECHTPVLSKLDRMVIYCQSCDAEYWDSKRSQHLTIAAEQIMYEEYINDEEQDMIYDYLNEVLIMEVNDNA